MLGENTDHGNNGQDFSIPFAFGHDTCLLYIFECHITKTVFYSIIGPWHLSHDWSHYFKSTKCM